MDGWIQPTEPAGKITGDDDDIELAQVLPLHDGLPDAIAKIAASTTPPPHPNADHNNTTTSLDHGARDDPAANGAPSTPPAPIPIPIGISRSLTLRLYTSHFLSTWNSRLFEAGVVYFLATIFPDNLLPVSLYALSRNLAAILFAVPVGHWIDTAHRLTVVRASIVGQRLAVAASCGLFWALLELRLGWRASRLVDGLFGASVLLACVEKLAAGVNLIAVERDWVVVITQGNDEARSKMNARMRRIDLFCKLLGPLTVALVAAASVKAAVYATLGMNLASVMVEYLCIETVFRRVPGLGRPSPEEGPAVQSLEPLSVVDGDAGSSSANFQLCQWLRGISWRKLPMIPSLRLYFGHPAVIPSLSLSLLFLTVLSFSGQMLTYLLASNLTLWQVGIVRGIATIFELSATWIAPRLMKRIGVLRTGLWSITWQMTWLAGGVSCFFYYYGKGYEATSLMSAVGLVVAVAFSRVGLWGFDLSVQNIVQDEVQDDRRGIFSSVEASFQNMFDMLAWALTIIWSSPNSFQWPMVISVAAVYAAGGLFAHFLRRRRGHLLHLPACIKGKRRRNNPDMFGVRWNRRPRRSTSDSIIL
ncbi:hypothetical protein QBC32DRAFT_219660 [Pseudoneurospora amorphoporcata]|uniref:Solute carrier family 40 member n=1 Tax=Pseudoneurospora amorphoporcata TaxID=241081 RepID=A0AAN6NP38_9PEZI|nr:hypothetical protein QBC32DRAFT_219660 [Pseudoneurospora amorphoporcata]